MMRVLTLAIAAMTIVSIEASAQDINKRTDAPPAAQATIGRVLPKARVQAAEQGKDLSKDIVNTDCGPLQVGNVDQQPSGVQPRENNVVVRGNIVNICK